MNNKLCVFGAKTGTDIDALACAIAYAELMDCIAYLPGPFNATIPSSVRKWDFNYTTEFPTTATEFVMVDFSTPGMIPEKIDQDKIIKVYDHHTGFEEYWGKRGQIEFIGAAATIIFELFGDRAPSATIANLLYTAIFANCLNFKAGLTSDRDHAAFNKLKQYVTLPESWIETYYNEIEVGLIADPNTALNDDIKYYKNGWSIAQLELYNAIPVLDKIISPENGFAIVVDIGAGKNYLFATSSEIKAALTDGLGAKWNGDIGITDKLYLRKEIVKIMNL